MSDRTFKFFRLIAALATVSAVGIFSWTFVHALLYAPDTEARVPTSSVRTVHRDFGTRGDLPVHFSIPSLGIDAAVQSVGVNAKGNMSAPNNFSDVGWYEYGSVPGEMGSAVIDGHVDNGLGLDGVFKHLSDIRVGDDVYVDTKGGQHLHFVVQDIESYPYKEVPTDQLFNLSDAVRLNLVTCEGSWVKGDKTYDHRLVVYTELKAS